MDFGFGLVREDPLTDIKTTKRTLIKASLYVCGLSAAAIFSAVDKAVANTSRKKESNSSNQNSDDSKNEDRGINPTDIY